MTADPPREHDAPAPWQSSAQAADHDGQWHDEVLMAVLRSEWTQGTLEGGTL